MIAKKEAFTLIEILMVIIIIGILSVVAVPKFINMRRDAMLASVAGSLAALRSGIGLQYSMINVHDWTQPSAFPTYSELSADTMSRDNGTYTDQLVVGGLPSNVFSSTANQAKMVNATGYAKSAVIGTSGGWAYNAVNGQIWANTGVYGENYL
jgi:prepilin-type N-terminal cleavage/methylation domain-containing protein